MACLFEGERCIFACFVDQDNGSSWMFIGIVRDVVYLVVDDDPHVRFGIVGGYFLPAIRFLSHLLKFNIIKATVFTKDSLIKNLFEANRKIKLGQIYIRGNQLAYIIAQTLIMKVKFISKKERDLIKVQRNNAPVIEYNRQKQVSTPSPEDLLQQYRNQQSNNNHPSSKDNKVTPNEITIKSEHLVGLQKQERLEQNRQRSRDVKYKQIVKDDLEERRKMKEKMLGLTKMQISQRHLNIYRNQLLFEWDKSQDTSKNYVPLLPQQAKKDFLTTEEEGNWKNKPFHLMTDRDWRIFREDHQIYIRGGKAPSPIRQWQQLMDVSSVILQNLSRLKFYKPKPIQMQAIPIGMNHKDLMAIAPTGEGKTLAYLLPIIHFLLPLQRLTMNNFDKGPYALILVPTRQLAEQIEEQFINLVKGLDVKSFVAVGGRQFELQCLQLAKGCDILIATPGRVKQFIEKHQLSLERLSWCVVDQADKMVSQNLAEDLEFILDHGGEDSVIGGGKKIIHMFSATMVPEVQMLGRSYLSASFTYITIGEPGGGKKQIDQHVQLIDEASKPDRLSKILRGLAGPIIVFVNSRQNCDKVSQMIQKRCDRTVAEYHGGKSQQQRERVIAQFRLGKIQIMVATDLAGRGLDVKGINAIINYDAPKNISEFIHRSGRTGRAGMKGKAFTLLISDDEPLFYDLRVFLQRNGFAIPENLKDHPAAQVRAGEVVQVARRKQIVYTN